MQSPSRGGVLPALTRLTFDAGLQTDVTWSPDGHAIAYASDKGGTSIFGCRVSTAEIPSSSQDQEHRTRNRPGRRMVARLSSVRSAREVVSW